MNDVESLHTCVPWRSEVFSYKHDSEAPWKRGGRRENIWLGLLSEGLFALYFSWCEAWLKVMESCFHSAVLTNAHAIRGWPTLNQWGIIYYHTFTFEVLSSVNALSEEEVIKKNI